MPVVCIRIKSGRDVGPPHGNSHTALPMNIDNHLSMQSCVVFVVVSTLLYRMIVGVLKHFQLRIQL